MSHSTRIIKLTQRFQLGSTGLMVSPVGFGVLPIGPAQLALPVDRGAEVLCHALKSGINFIDTAQYYQAYPYIKEGLRLFTQASDNIIICSKSLATGYQEMHQAIAEACQELDRPYIDIFLLHEVRPGQFQQRQAAWQALLDAKTKGFVRAIGVSTHHVDVVEEMAACPECDVVFPLINVASMGIRCGIPASQVEEPQTPCPQVLETQVPCAQASQVLELRVSSSHISQVGDISSAQGAQTSSLQASGSSPEHLHQGICGPPCN